MRLIALLLLLSHLQLSGAATIAIIDTGFDLDHDFLKPRVLKQETDEEAINPNLKEFSDWQFHDNNHLKEPVIKDQSLLQEILLYRNLRAKGHREGLTLAEFEWFKKRSANKEFMTQVKNFKKHSHGTFVAGIALREGENINIFPIRGLHISVPVVAVEENSAPKNQKLKSKTPEDRFREEIKNSQDRVVKKFSKICRYLSMNKVGIVNASYGITYKNTTSKFREKYKELTDKEIDETTLQYVITEYFANISNRTRRIIQKYPNMLFVFSAGNSGLDNDVYPHYPSKIKLHNTITVGALNGDYLASFSNYGRGHVDIGAPGVAILSLVPKVYSTDGKEIYSPSSGTSMAAPFISNIAAQISNINPKLKPQDIKKIIMETGDEKEHLKTSLISGAVVSNQKALKAALLSQDLPLDQSISLAKSGLIPMEDTVSFGQPPAINPEKLKQKMMDTIPKNITPEEIDEIQSTTEQSSPLMNPAKDKQDNLAPPASAAPTPQAKAADPAPSSQNEEQFPPPSLDLPPSSSQSSLQLPQTPDSKSELSSP